MGQSFVAVPSYVVASFARPVSAAVADPWAEPSARPAVVRAFAARPASLRPPAKVARHRTATTEPAEPAHVDSVRVDVRVLGPLAGYAANPETTDLFVNGESGLWIDAGHGLAFAPAWQLGEAEVRGLAVRLIALGGRHIDEASPCVDVRLADGIRVHAVLPPVSSTGTLLSIRLPHAANRSLGALADAGLFGVGEASAARLNRLRAAVRGRQNLLITGAAGSGKTTLLAALLGEAPADERIVAIEDVAELRIRHPHVVALEARQANLEGAGRIGLEALLREALRMRPDRLVLGECRGAEIRELLGALNTGHDGGAGTLHANSLEDVPARLEALGALAGMSAAAVARQTVSAIGLVLHLERTDGVRRLDAVGRFTLNGRDRLSIEAV
ncbi:MAG: TadA family conjugal transfer-associated ATPase [Cryobacterium sp.]|uniref:TadA family conjugal transfer-associated ATPase n=1 Tax=Cryobacterium sp. TaxID=1926290 RepID=UPI002291461C|nr:TadA family conjugal transfer-associated ATPase [Cryobacterium sp.]MCY7405457.1 TadA family conjugal transfer-associated ATPase [Cryobacterium sp.]